MSETLFIFLFIAFVVMLLGIDLGLINKKDHEVKPKEALIWTAVWVSLALGFYTFVLLKGEWIHGIENFTDLAAIKDRFRQDFTIFPESWDMSIQSYRKALSVEYLTGYIVEESLSLDNLFVILLILTSFSVPQALYHRVLFWGILGAIVFRFIFIFSGALIINQFHWVLYLFAAFLVYAGLKLLFGKDEDETIDIENHYIVKFSAKYFRVWPTLEGNKFFIKSEGKRYITPLMVVLFIVETSDVIFAVDSIPAIFAVTRDPYIVFFSNIFAILGLRSLFFLIQTIFGKLRFFKLGLSALLVFIGLKMFFESWLDKIGFTNFHSLMVILGILTLSISASLMSKQEE